MKKITASLKDAFYIIIRDDRASDRTSSASISKISQHVKNCLLQQVGSRRQAYAVWPTFQRKNKYKMVVLRKKDGSV